MFRISHVVPAHGGGTDHSDYRFHSRTKTRQGRGCTLTPSAASGSSLRSSCTGSWGIHLRHRRRKVPFHTTLSQSVLSEGKKSLSSACCCDTRGRTRRRAGRRNTHRSCYHQTRAVRRRWRQMQRQKLAMQVRFYDHWQRYRCEANRLHPRGFGPRIRISGGVGPSVVRRCVVSSSHVVCTTPFPLSLVSSHIGFGLSFSQRRFLLGFPCSYGGERCK
jgi:hypothetical protein